MNDPEPPRVDDGEVGVAVEEERRQIEKRNRQRRIQKQRRDLALRLNLPLWPDGPKQQEKPDHQAQGEQCLPGPSQLEILPALMTEPEPEISQQPIDSERLAKEASANNENKSGKEEVHTEYLSLRVAAADSRCQQKSAADIGRRNPEDSQLHVPRSQEIARKKSAN